MQDSFILTMLWVKKTKCEELCSHSDSLFGQETSHGIGSSHEQHHLPVEVDEEGTQESTGNPAKKNL